MTERKYFYVREGSHTPAGPHTLPELARLRDMGELTEATMVAESGASEWTELGKVLTAHAAELSNTPTALPPVPGAAALPPIPGGAPTIEVPETAGSCPNCGQEIPLNGHPVLPEHCPHCNLLLRAENPDNLWQQFIVALKKSFIMRGRATRMEYWGFYIFTYVISCCISIPISILEMMYMTEEQLLNYGEHYLDAGFWNSPAGMLQLARFGVSLIFVIPTLSAGVRRLHDIGRSGWWLAALYLLPFTLIPPFFWIFTDESMLIPALISLGVITLLIFALSITVLVFMFTDSQKGRNRYGVSPKYPWL